MAELLRAAGREFGEADLVGFGEDEPVERDHVEQIGQFFRATREAQKLSQEQLALLTRRRPE